MFGFEIHPVRRYLSYSFFASFGRESREQLRVGTELWKHVAVDRMSACSEYNLHRLPRVDVSS